MRADVITFLVLFVAGAFFGYNLHALFVLQHWMGW